MSVLIDSRPTISDAHSTAVVQNGGEIPALHPHPVPRNEASVQSRTKQSEATSSAPHAQQLESNLAIVDRYIDEPRSLKVAIIGGGLAGILAGVLLPAKVPRIQLTIYEKNEDLVSKTSLFCSH